MEVRSLAWRTDLRLRELEGASVSDLGDVLVVRKADQPDFRWGNFLLLSGAAADEGLNAALARFRTELPDCEHVAIGLDCPSGELGCFAGAAAVGLELEVNAVLAAAALTSPGRPAPDAELRPLDSDSDWREGTAVRAADDDGSEAGYRRFVEQQMLVARRVCERGEGTWFGAFRDGEMLAGLGIFRAGEGLARFQNVDTRAEHRRQGLAGHLLVAAAEHARLRLGARRLVIVADPGYHAIEIYRSIGFREIERQVQLERAR
jgi:ribosomal protein S18 acetylase RimI-like enzyme